LQTGGQQVHGIAAAIRFRCGGIGRQRERILARTPWLLPGRDALFEHVDDVVRYLLPEVALLR
jgi:hypothetical protein